MDKNLEKWQKELDDLKVDLDLDTDDVVETFQTYKESLSEYIDEVAEKVEDNLGDRATSLRSKLEELRVQLALGRAETRDAYEEQRKKLDQTLHETNHEMHKLGSAASGAWSETKMEVETQLEKFRTRLDLFRLHFHLGMSDAKDELEEKRRSLHDELHRLRHKVEKAEESSEDKWEEFSEEIGKTFSHFRSAVKKLFD